MGPDRSPLAKTRAQHRLQTRDFCSILVVSVHPSPTTWTSSLLLTRLSILTYFIPTAQRLRSGVYGSITYTGFMTTGTRSTASRRLGLQQNYISLCRFWFGSAMKILSDAHGGNHGDIWRSRWYRRIAAVHAAWRYLSVSRR
jgi:hypothetical protein